MFTHKPLVWVDVDRIRMSDLERIAKQGYAVVPVHGDPHRVVMVTGGGTPTPDQLFRWTPKESHS